MFTTQATYKGHSTFCRGAFYKPYTFWGNNNNNADRKRHDSGVFDAGNAASTRESDSAKGTTP